jgi:catechol 2,3-dioxygenase-like lactoylglutathione lyase family enzyme
MSHTVKAYLEHVAIRVADIRWHIDFFYEALGMDVREVQGDPANPSQYWTLGGMQFISTPGFAAPPTLQQGVLGHLGVMVDDLDEAIRRCVAHGATPLPARGNWLELPDGLCLELMQAAPGSVAQALKVNPRAQAA